MFYLGICDDNAEDRKRLRDYVNRIFTALKQEYRIYEFTSSEETMAAFSKDEEFHIDLLFLDIEMDGVNGIQLRDILIKMSQVWRIVFVSYHEESMADAFGLKTIGFLSKPAQIDQIEKKIKIVLKEYNENRLVELPSSQAKKNMYRLDHIAYFEAEGNYTRVHLCDEDGRLKGSELISCIIKEIEGICDSDNLLRIHKSFIVNMINVLNVSNEVILRDPSVRLPVGRSYREQAKEKYMNFILKKARERY